MSDYEISELKELKNFSVEIDLEDSLILSKRNSLYFSSKKNLKVKNKLGEFKLPLWKKCLINSNLLQRLLRCFFYNVIMLDNGDIFVTFDKSIGIIKKNGKFEQLEGFDRPFRVLRNAIAKNSDGNLYFGEYLSNSDRGIVKVFSYKPGSSNVDIVHTFESGSIRHIHGIYFDKYSDSLWCITGDNPKECKFLKTHDGFKTINVVGSGDETWRAVSLLFTKKYIYYAMDAEFIQNKIYRISRDNYIRTEIGIIDGPVYYSIKKGEKYFFQVTSELCPSQKDKNASLWQVEGNSVSKIWSRRKDVFPLVFMPGTIHFPYGKGSNNEIYFNCIGISKTSKKTFRLQLN